MGLLFSLWRMKSKFHFGKKEMTVWRGLQEAVPRKEAGGRKGGLRETEQEGTPAKALSFRTPRAYRQVRGGFLIFTNLQGTAGHCFPPGSGVIVSGGSDAAVSGSPLMRVRNFPACSRSWIFHSPERGHAGRTETGRRQEGSRPGKNGGDYTVTPRRCFTVCSRSASTFM